MDEKKDSLKDVTTWFVWGSADLQARDPRDDEDRVRGKGIDINGVKA